MGAAESGAHEAPDKACPPACAVTWLGILFNTRDLSLTITLIDWRRSQSSCRDGQGAFLVPGMICRSSSASFNLLLAVFDLVGSLFLAFSISCEKPLRQVASLYLFRLKKMLPVGWNSCLYTMGCQWFLGRTGASQTLWCPVTPALNVVGLWWKVSIFTLNFLILLLFAHCVLTLWSY